MQRLLSLAFALVVAVSSWGVFAISQSVAVGQAIEDLVLTVECSEQEDWDGQVRFLPF